MPVSIYCRKNHIVDTYFVDQAMTALLGYSKKKQAMLEIELLGNQRMQKLNAQFRGKNYATDVLSFPQDAVSPFKNGPWHLGEIIISTTIAQQQAKRAGRSLNFQVLRLAVHGLVHLEGLDHERNSKEKLLFEAREIKYLDFLNKKGWISWDGSLQL